MTCLKNRQSTDMWAGVATPPPPSRPRHTHIYKHILYNHIHIQSTSLITTLGGASKRCPYSRSVVIPEVSSYVLQWDGTLLWAWKFCRYSRIVVISAVVIREVDCTHKCEHIRTYNHVYMCRYSIQTYNHVYMCRYSIQTYNHVDITGIAYRHMYTHTHIP